MRHAISVAGLLALGLTIAAWFGGPTVQAVSPASGTAKVLDLVERRAPTPTPVLSDPPASTSTLKPTAVAVAEADAEGDDGASFVAELNTLREGRGLTPLIRRPELDGPAQSWAEQLAADADLRHSELIYDVIAGPFTTAGENVGYGPEVEVIFDALEASPGHLRNMVNPDFTSVGIGVVRVGDVLWTAHLFAG